MRRNFGPSAHDQHQDVLRHATSWNERVASEARTKGLKLVNGMQFVALRYLSEAWDERDYSIPGKGLQFVGYRVAGLGSRGGKKVVLIEAKRLVDYIPTSYDTATEISPVAVGPWPKP